MSVQCKATKSSSTGTATDPCTPILNPACDSHEQDLDAGDKPHGSAPKYINNTLYCPHVWNKICLRILVERDTLVQRYEIRIRTNLSKALFKQNDSTTIPIRFSGMFSDISAKVWVHFFFNLKNVWNCSNRGHVWPKLARDSD